MGLYETKIQEKILDLPDDIKKEVLDYVEYLSQRYKKKIKVKKNIEENPFLELSGFVEIGNMTSQDIDKEVYGL
ncbi:MAG: hypothetical protein A2086_03015 [Spirochaetes bacterium GWD1_27_9]|nr:MAG: hypothetical protein A2Z98_14020 [Spirochaetes bacterium GWB1_27_13]OHD27413.1 MAG: hypothetical protein A2Y34_10635 [Spirochaetes bacterium GWC1_27_15]OHD31356.1 MAG: hypothetical protein A2086_03015 [Spirochaetes bacterium GWD1_27_9]